MAYALLGEVHVPGRLRAYHVLRKIRQIQLDRRGGLRVLDAGCGRGDLVLSFAKSNPSWQVVGVELDPERLNTALFLKEKLGLQNLDVREGNLLNLKLDGEFDLITCCDVLEHIEKDKEVMANLYKALKPGGSLLLTFPSIPQRKHLKLVGWRERKIGFQNSDYGHVRDGYSIEGITDTLGRIGFSAVHCDYTFGFWGNLSFDLFFVLGDNNPNPFIFMLFFPLLMTTAALDLYLPSKQGSALLVVATK